MHMFNNAIKLVGNCCAALAAQHFCCSLIGHNPNILNIPGQVQLFVAGVPTINSIQSLRGGRAPTYNYAKYFNYMFIEITNFNSCDIWWTNMIRVRREPSLKKIQSRWRSKTFHAFTSWWKMWPSKAMVWFQCPKIHPQIKLFFPVRSLPVTGFTSNIRKDQHKKVWFCNCPALPARKSRWCN